MRIYLLLILFTIISCTSKQKNLSRKPASETFECSSESSRTTEVYNINGGSSSSGCFSSIETLTNGKYLIYRLSAYDDKNCYYYHNSTTAALRKQVTCSKAVMQEALNKIFPSYSERLVPDISELPVGNELTLPDRPKSYETQKPSESN